MDLTVRSTLWPLEILVSSGGCLKVGRGNEETLSGRTEREGRTIIERATATFPCFMCHPQTLTRDDIEWIMLVKKIEQEEEKESDIPELYPTA